MDKHWDVIIIGAGLGGLTAGALMAKGGVKVLLLERHDRPGGCATNFTRKGITVEVGLHEMDGMDEGDAKVKLFQHLGVLDRIELIPVPEFYAIRSKHFDGEFTLPHGEAEAKQALLAEFPTHRQGILSFFKEIIKLRKAVVSYAAAEKNWLWWLLNGPIFPLRFKSLITHEKTTVSEMMQKFFGGDEKIKLALTANLTYYSDDPDKMSFMFFGLAQSSFLLGGGHFIKGGSQKLSEALVEVITENGGEVRLNRLATDIIITADQVSGITHAKAPLVTSRNPKPPQDFQTESTKLVLSGAAPSVTAQMLPAQMQKTFMTPFAAHPPGTSLWSIYLGLNQKPEKFGATAYSTFIMPDWYEDISDLSVDLLAGLPGDKAAGCVFVDYSRIDSGLGEENKYFATLCGIDHLKNWEDLNEEDYKAKKAAWQEAIMQSLEKTFPGIRESVFYEEMATAKTMKRYLNTPNGEVYGFSQEPSSAGRYRPGPSTPISNLYLASAFSSPGGGFTGAIFSGATAAREAAKTLKKF